MDHRNSNLMLKIAHIVLDASQTGDTFPDWKEDIKTLCAQQHIPYDSLSVGNALEAALYQRKRNGR